MAHEIFRAISNLRVVLNTETDADSPDNETTYAAMREMIEILFQLMVGTGDDGTATADPPDDTTGVLTDSAGGYSVDEYNGCTLLITSGMAKGYTYTIDDTTATTLVCTDDNLYTDGVRSGDYYIVLYDIKANLDGHDHDTVNSKAVVGVADNSIDSQHYVSDSIDNIHYAPGSVDQTAIGSNAVGQGEMKDSTVAVSTGTGGANLSISAASSFGFWPQIKVDSGGSMSCSVASAVNPGASYVSSVFLALTAGSGNVFAQFRYISASGEVYWIFIMRNKATKKVLASVATPDHVCFGNGGKPALLEHPFIDVYEEAGRLMHPIIKDGAVVGSEEVELLVINPTKEVMEDMHDLCDVEDDLEPNLCILEVLDKHYKVDDSFEPPWPSEPVTVGLQKRGADGKIIDYTKLPEGTKISTIKKVIPKPNMVRTAAMLRK